MSRDIQDRESAITAMARLQSVEIITNGDATSNETTGATTFVASIPDRGAVVGSAAGGRITVALLIPNDTETIGKVEQVRNVYLFATECRHLNRCYDNHVCQLPLS